MVGFPSCEAVATQALCAVSSLAVRFAVVLDGGFTSEAQHVCRVGILCGSFREKDIRC